MAHSYGGDTLSALKTVVVTREGGSCQTGATQQHTTEVLPMESSVFWKNGKSILKLYITGDPGPFTFPSGLHFFVKKVLKDRKLQGWGAGMPALQ